MPYVQGQPQAPPVKRGRGRPKGSKNKPKDAPVLEEPQVPVHVPRLPPSALWKTHHNYPNMNGHWGKNIDYEVTGKKIVDLMAQFREECKHPEEFGGTTIYPARRLAYATTLLIQLSTFSRASEALDALFTWIQRAPERRFNNAIVVRKHRKRCLQCKHVKTGRKSGHGVTGWGERGRCLVAGCQCAQYVPDPNDVQFRDMWVPPDVPESDVPMLKVALAPAFNRRTHNRKVVTTEPLTVTKYEQFARRWLVNTAALRAGGITNEVKKGRTFPQIMVVSKHKSADVLIHYAEQAAGAAIEEELQAHKFA